MSNQEIRPSRWWYALAVAVVVAGSVAYGVLIGTTFNEMSGRMTRGLPVAPRRVVVPGESDITLSEPGRYMVFYEYHTVVGDKAYSTGRSFPGLQCTLVAKTTGSQVALSPCSFTATYGSQDRLAVSVFEFTIPDSGTYELSASYPEGEKGPEVVLAIRRRPGDMLKDLDGQFERTFRTAALGMAVWVGSIAAGIAVAALTHSKRRKARRRLQMLLHAQKAPTPVAPAAPDTGPAFIPMPAGRSTFVTVLAWIFIVGAGFFTAGGLIQNAVLNLTDFGDGFPWFLRVVALAFLVLCATTFVSSIGLLKRRNWARKFFIALMALGIVYILGSFLVFARTMLMGPPDLAAGFQGASTLFAVVCVIWVIGWCVLFVWIIKRLMSQKIKSEFMKT